MHAVLFGTFKGHAGTVHLGHSKAVVGEFDSVFCERLMPGLGGGITGGDGSISIDLKDGRSLFCLLYTSRCV